jgi:hypothetical protein
LGTEALRRSRAGIRLDAHRRKNLVVAPRHAELMKRVLSSAVIVLSVLGAVAAAAQDDAKDPGQIGREGAPFTPPAPLLPSPFCSTPGTVIHDLTTLRDVLSIPDDFDLIDVQVSLDVSHSYLSDLEISLSHGGVTVDLLWDDCGAYNDLAVTLGDGDGPLACGEPTVGTGEPTRRNGPRGFLSAFNGLNINGEWVLTVTDDGEGDQGTLNAWCVISTPIPIELLGFELD